MLLHLRFLLLLLPLPLILVLNIGPGYVPLTEHWPGPWVWATTASTVAQSESPGPTEVDPKPVADPARIRTNLIAAQMGLGNPNQEAPLSPVVMATSH